MTKVLIVGAGAVGQVYGHYLQRGGAEVSFFVKEKYKEECEQGFALYRSRRVGLSAPERFKAESILTSYDEVAEGQWDQVWIAIASTDLRGEWLSTLKNSIGSATLVMLQPDLDDRDYVLELFPSEQLVYGLANFLSYQTPLPDMPSHHRDFDKKGVAYLLLPMMSAEFSGDPERLPGVLDVLADGRFPVKVQQNVPRIYADRSAMMIPLIALLEVNTWSIERLRHSDLLDTSVDAVQEALGVVAAKFHRPLNLTEKYFSAWWLKVGLPFIRWLAPMDVESFLKYQFQKTSGQTRFMLQHFIVQGEKEGKNVSSLRTLLDRLPAMPENNAFDSVPAA
ncbi:hypothetical protein A9Q81_25650 [Gammaproteobacteria bacterium 42_54_T18]|nr:hypothetical protein A9Q81_25650 [Gammaproteobacteria bacterium 42_54_T18]